MLGATKAIRPEAGPAMVTTPFRVEFETVKFGDPIVLLKEVPFPPMEAPFRVEPEAFSVAPVSVVIAEPKLALARASVPAATVAPPEAVLAPVRFTVPKLVFTRASVPPPSASEPAKVVIPASPRVRVAEPVLLVTLPVPAIEAVVRLFPARSTAAPALTVSAEDPRAFALPERSVPAETTVDPV